MKYFLFAFICLVLLACTKPNEPVQDFTTKSEDTENGIDIKIDTTNTIKEITIEIII